MHRWLTKLERRSVPVHGIWRQETKDLEWLEYWVGIEHTWYWYGIPIWTRTRQRHTPFHRLLKAAFGS